jgi:hypothetical protein
MNVIITDAFGAYVSNGGKDTNAFGYRMFGTVLVIFTNDIFLIPYIQLNGVQNKTQPVSSRFCICF